MAKRGAGPDREPINTDRLTLREILLRFPMGPGLTVLGVVIFGWGGLAGSAGYWAGKLEAKSQLIDTRAQLRNSQTERDALRDLNTQKVCANYTVQQKQAAVRRLQRALRSLKEHLELKKVTLKEPATEPQSIPLFSIRYFGLDGIDPTLFPDDDRLVEDAQGLVEAIDVLNALLDRARGVDRALVGYSEAVHDLNKHFMENREATIVGIEKASEYLVDRYGVLPASGNTVTTGDP